MTDAAILNVAGIPRAASPRASPGAALRVRPHREIAKAHGADSLARADVLEDISNYARQYPRSRGNTHGGASVFSRGQSMLSSDDSGSRLTRSVDSIHPTTGEEITLYLDEMDRIEVVK